MRYTCLAILLYVLIGCNSGIKYPEGGYDYLKTIHPEDSNFYYRPVKDSFSTRDSFWNTWLAETFYKKIGEPNISLRALNEDVFRFHWSAALGGTYFITLKKDSLIVKSNFLIADTCNSGFLSPIEKEHLDFLGHYFPLNRQFGRNMTRYIDSITKIYPQLLDIKYYYSLLKKSGWNSCSPFYTQKFIPLTEDEFNNLISAINNSGYWQLPVNIHCVNPASDYATYVLEANTLKKYNCVISCECDYTAKTLFAKACQQLVNKAGLGNKINLCYITEDSNSVTPIIVPDVQLVQPIAPEISKQGKKKH